MANIFTDNDIRYMRRALQLARCGEGRTGSNPMVGAVIVADGRIIGEGYHRHYGGPHAEVNAVQSVKDSDLHLLPASTIYVTLEPCSHYGKTPPCAQLLIDRNIPRIIVGALDPFPKVSGRGINMLRQAGREVLTGCLEDECRNLNRRFMLAHERQFPYIQLKWAQSADAFISPLPGAKRAIFSTPLSMVMMHHQRALAGAIAVGVNTIIADNPRLDCRLWPGQSPMKLSNESPRIPQKSNFLTSPNILRRKNESLRDFLTRIYKEHNILSVMVEGGLRTLNEYIANDLFDEVRIEVSPRRLYSGINAPQINLSALTLISNEQVGENSIFIFQR